MFELTPILDEKLETPMYIQLYEFIKQQIEESKIERGTQLPSKRKLAAYLSTSRNTVENALGQLIAEGYVESVPRVGLFVADISDSILHNQHEQMGKLKNSLEKSLSFKYDFSQGHVDLNFFPYKTWKKLMIQCLQIEEKELLLGGHSQGEVELREEIAQYLYQSRGVKCTAEQIVVGAGTQYLLGLICRLMGRETVCALEEPCFHRSRETIRSHGMKIIPINVEVDGLKVDDLINTNANLVYVTPSHQFPTGGILSIQKRYKLLEWANENDAYILEDDYDGEFRYRGKPIPALQGLDTNDRVIYLGTFSKSFIPSLRISYVVLPKHFIVKHYDHIMFQKQTVSRVNQKALELFMKEGHWGRHLNKMRTLYRKKQKVLQKAILEKFEDRVKVIGIDSGLHILLQVHIAETENSLIQKAENYSVKVYPSSVYYTGDHTNESPQILLGFGGLSETEIVEGIERLHQAWF